MSDEFTIAAVSSQTGIAKEVLRKWETRYGFPVPVRDDTGNRLYTAAQANRLRLIKKLIDDGMRPGQVVPLDESALAALLAQAQSKAVDAPGPEAPGEVVAWLRSRDPALLRERLEAKLVRLGLARFVCELMPAMNHQVGEAWASAEIAVRDEHLYAETVQGLVREAVSRIHDPAGYPRILLTTPTGELHTLGILMLEAALSIQGAYCISLGAQSPLPEIASAAREFGVEIIGLSFSASFPMRKIYPILKQLRAQLPTEVQLWAGGAGTARMDKTPRGATLVPTLPEAVRLLEKYQPRLPGRGTTL